MTYNHKHINYYLYESDFVKLKTLQQIGEETSAALITDLYRFEATRGAEGEFAPEVELLAAADIYDALTSPKIYKHALAGQGELLHGEVLPRDPELDSLVEKIRGRRRPPARPAAAPAPSPASAAADDGTIAVDPRRVLAAARKRV